MAGVQATHNVGMYCISIAGERDLPSLYATELMVHDLTEVNVERVRSLAT